jgi:LEA14-like dessication related protein
MATGDSMKRQRQTRTYLLSILSGLLLITLPSCAFLQSLMKLGPQPTAAIVGIRLTDLSLSDVSLVFDIAVRNPYAVPLPLANVDYKLSTQATQFLEGQAPIQGTVPANGSKTISLPVKITFAGLMKVVQGLKPGVLLPYKGTLGLSVNVPKVGPLRMPLEKEGQVPIPAVPNVSVTSVKWQHLSLSGATGLVKIKIGNTNQFPVNLANFQYVFKLGGLDMASGALTNPANLAAGAAQEIGINVSVSTAKAGMAIMNLLNGSSSQYTLGGALAIGTPFGPLNIPLSVSGQVPFLK